ncbi:MAG: molybdopterin-binding protein [Chloroflexi bacterium]|nr:molybdopterin-binding protein [Chloroflexota bacterium]
MVIRTGILTIPTADDQAVQVVSQRLQQVVPGLIVLQESSARSQRNWIEDILRRWCDEEELDLIVTIGGTFPAPGPSADEIVPEATLAVLERLLPGLSEAMRAYAQTESELALLDRGVAGIRGRTIILNLPNGAAPAALFLEAIVELIGPLAAHLQSEPNAPRLSDVLEIRPDKDEDLPVDLPIGPINGLNAEEFSAFLQRTRTC